VTIRLAHLSDTHIGYEAYKQLSANGENQRSVDIAKAFVAAIGEIVEADPPLVIHSGDLSDRTIIPIRLMLLIRHQIQRLAAIRPDGTRRQLVIIAGNHELPRNRKEACFLHLFDGLPGVHVVTRDYTQVTFPGVGVSAGCDAALADVVVHCLPHDALKTVDFDVVLPLPDKTNILTAHGVAGGSELYLRSLGREFTIPTGMLSRSWEYGALGHWHKQGPVPLVSTGATTPDSGRVWYAGSTENMGFGDLRENGTRRGWLHVTIKPGAVPEVDRRYVPIRTMMRLPVLDGSALTPEQLADALIARIRVESVSGAVVGQIVENVTRDVWSLVDLVKVRAAAGDALHYEVSLRTRAHVDADGKEERPTGRGLGDADRVLEEVAITLLNDQERDGGLLMARELLANELERISRTTVNDDNDAAAPTSDEDASGSLAVTEPMQETQEVIA
jgi:DNA repair exonuclease SbcCD nuclease subunit